MRMQTKFVVGMASPVLGSILPSFKSCQNFLLDYGNWQGQKIELTPSFVGTASLVLEVLLLSTCLQISLSDHRL